MSEPHISVNCASDEKCSEESDHEMSEDKHEDPLVEVARSTLDEGSQPLPGLDFNPSTEIAQEDSPEMESQTECPVEQKEIEVVDEKPEESEDMEKEEDVEINRVEEQSVVVEEIAEFGVESTSELFSVGTAAEETSEDPTGASGGGKSVVQRIPCKDESIETEVDKSKEETKVIVKGSGGFVLKVNQDSVVVSNNNDQLQSNSCDTKLIDDSGLNADDNEEDADSDHGTDWRPPSPDPRFKNFPPVRKGSDMSGLCTIM